MIKLYIENIVTDLKSYKVTVPQDIIKNISYDIDIQNSNVQPIELNKWTDIKKKFVLIADNNTNNIIAIYNKDKFDYNPKKIKTTNLTDDIYTCYEVINNKGSVMSKRNTRLQSRQGYTDLQSTETSYNKPPKSTRYVFDRDWNPEINKEYYTKLLHQNKLSKYADQLEYTYTIMEKLIEYRRQENTVGKKGVYTNWIKKLATQIETAETLMDALDKNINVDIPKLLKSLKTLDTTTKQASQFIDYEDETISSFGRAAKRSSAVISR